MLSKYIKHYIFNASSAFEMTYLHCSNGILSQCKKEYEIAYGKIFFLKPTLPAHTHTQPREGVDTETK